MSSIIDLSGSWEFLLDKEKKGLDLHYENRAFNDTFIVPGTVSYRAKGVPGNDRPEDHLYDPYAMEGYCWFRRKVQITGFDEGRKYILHIERTRISRVWVDGEYIGTCDSFAAPHEYDLTGFIKHCEPELTIMVSNTGYALPGGHMTSPDTQTNWNGMLGEVSLIACKGLRITDVSLNAENNSAVIEVTNYAEPVKAELKLEMRKVKLKSRYFETDSDMSEINVLAAAAPEKTTCAEEIEKLVDIGEEAENAGVSVMLDKGSNTVSVPIDAKLAAWSDTDPELYLITAATGEEIKTALKGAVKFETRGKEFIVNGRRTFLRGKHDGMIFPLTGFAPMNVYGWLRVMKTAKDFGINHYRFHTCCPPEAAFIAADLLGIYMQPELPFWGTFNARGDEGYSEKENSYLEAEGLRMLEAFSSHPSYCMMSMGNELWGSAEAINELMGKLKAYKPDILYTQGSNNFQWVPCIVPNDSFFSGVRFTLDRQIRGSYASCDRPFGHVQRDVPGTRFNYQQAINPPYIGNAAEVKTDADGYIEIQYGTGIKRVKASEAAQEFVSEIPVVSHEVGQYVTYPPFSEMDKYTGVLKPRNFELFRERLEEKGLLHLAEDYFLNSGKLAVACYRDEIETVMRTQDLAGFQLLDLQDFAGQGTALVGVLDAFMENKGLISAKEWRRFCSDLVLQAEFDSYVLENGNDFIFDISLRSLRYDLLERVILNIVLEEMHSGSTLYELTEETEFASVIGRSLLKTDIAVALPDDGQNHRYRLHVSLADEERVYAENEYTLYAYPHVPECLKNKEALKAKYGYCESMQEAKNRKKALLMLSEEENTNCIKGAYAADFWCFRMFRSISEGMNKPIPAGTMGLLNRTEHPALKGFECESFTTPQWFSIVENTPLTVLDGTDIEPVCRMIDNYERNHSLGLIYEMKQDDSCILVCTADLPRLVCEGKPEALALLASLSAYVNG